VSPQPTIPLCACAQVPLWSEIRFNWSSFNIGVVLAYAGVILIIIQTLGVKVLVPRLGEYTVLVTAMMFGVAHFVLLGLTTHGWMWFVVLPITCPWFLYLPSIRGLMSKSVPRSDQGKLQGVAR
jgi:DHA1 family tetracycline resistance protein-like MFS transporter